MLNDAKRLPLDLNQSIPLIIQSKQRFLSDVLAERLFKTGKRINSITMEKYLDPKEPGSLADYINFTNPKMVKSREKKLKFLKQQDAYTLHKYKRIHFKETE